MSSSGFRGFAEFASPDFASSGSTTAAAILAVARTKKQKNQNTSVLNHGSSFASSENEQSNKPIKPNLLPSPIYTGSDHRLFVLFRKIGQKRDPTTKFRALQELTATVYPPLIPNNESKLGQASDKEEDFTRPEKIAALCHLVFLHQTKLGYDNSSQVRAGSYKAITAAKMHVPKAWSALFLADDLDNSELECNFPAAASTIGMAWGASKGDPSTEVARNATAFMNELIPLDANEEQLINTNFEPPASFLSFKSWKLIEQSVLQYSRNIIECKRASSLQDVVNATSVFSSSSFVNSDNSNEKKSTVVKGAKVIQKDGESVTAISTSEREELEERYERVFLSVLVGLGSLVQCHPENISSNRYSTNDFFPKASSISRLMQSSRGSFRRESFNLVAKLCQFAPSLAIPPFDDSKSYSNAIPLATLIPNALSAEKDPLNFIALFEMLLTYLSAHNVSKMEMTDSINPWVKMSAHAFTKSLSKVLRRSCYGAPATGWTPTILPLVASLTRGLENSAEKVEQPLPLLVIESLWDGRKSAVSIADTSAIVSAVAECVTYLLLRQSRDVHSLFSLQSWLACGKLFLDALAYFLNEAPDLGCGPSGSATEELCATLSQDIDRLDLFSDDSSAQDRGIHQIKSWIWSEDGVQKTLTLRLREKQTELKLIALMKKMKLSTLQTETRSCQLIPSLKKLFYSILKHSTSRVNKVCSLEETELILIIIQLCGVNVLFPLSWNEEPEGEEVCLTVENFCLNNLIAWIILHASSIPAAVPTDFHILKLCLHSTQSIHQQREVWETILREMIVSNCDLTTLAIGLSRMSEDEDCSRSKNMVQVLRCSVLDKFAIEISNAFISSYWQSKALFQHDDDKEEIFTRSQDDFSLFFKTCVGLSTCRSILVSSSVIIQLAQICCGIDIMNTKPEYKFNIEDDSGSNVLLETLLEFLSSHNDSEISHDLSLKLIMQSWFEGGKIWDHTTVQFLLLAQEQLIKEDVISIASSSLHRDIHSIPPADISVLELTCKAWSKRSTRLLQISSSSNLELVGLHSVDIWTKYAHQKNPSEFLFLCLMYLLYSIDSTENRRKLLFQNADCQLFVLIQISITDVEDAHLQSFEHRTRRNCQLTEILGGREELTLSLLEKCCIQCVDLMSTLMKNFKSTPEDESHINHALCALSYLISLLFPTRYSTKDESMKEKNAIRDASENYVSVTATEITAFDNVLEPGEPSKMIFHPRSVCLSPGGNILAVREYMGWHMYNQLIKPYFSQVQFQHDSFILNIPSAECVNIILSQIGFVSSGIGSVKHEIFQVISSLESCLCAIFAGGKPNLKNATGLLEGLSLALGYNVFTHAKPNSNLADLKINSGELFNNILNLYENVSCIKKQEDLFKLFQKSVAMWFAVGVSELEDQEQICQASAIIIELSNILLTGNEEEALENSMYVMKAIRTLIGSSLMTDFDGTHIFDKIIQYFVDTKYVNGFWIEMFTLLTEKIVNEMPKVAFQGVHSLPNELIECLFIPMKRNCALKLLNIYAKRTHPHESNDNLIDSFEMQRFFSKWKESIDEEEAIELENDAKVAVLWLPENIISLFLGTFQEEISALDIAQSENQLMGNLLVWILFLNILDNAGTTDSRNRLSIISFLQKTNSLGFIMNLALQEADLEVSHKSKIFQCSHLDEEDECLIQKVATYTVFKTVESLPTLIKTWFNNDCPRNLQQKLSSFVETKIAPETLRRELQRINEATSFGDMSVRGSCISREVIACYNQDESQLSVTIRIPPTFPLRNVEVDCQKTLGIAENRWRRWALQIMLMLNNQDGSILDALILWKQNVDKEFDGVEPCPICYSVLCVKTHVMPNLECKTCKNRFHASCLYKWFQSCGNSSCVLCQQPWSGTRVA